MAVLSGDALAKRAWDLARHEDASRLGMTVDDLAAALRRNGESIRGDNPASVLRTALNRNQHLWQNWDTGIWLWIEDPVDPKRGLSGKVLADAAWELARELDPQRRGVYFEKLAQELRDRGTEIRGPQEGGTLTSALAASSRFEKSSRGDGIWVWVA